MKRIVHNNVNVPVIIETVTGDLRLRGRGSDLVVESESPHVEQIGDGQPFVVRCASDCRITLPPEVDISVQQVGGDAKLTELVGAVDIISIGGNLTLRNVITADVKTVGGDLRVKWASDSITVGSVGADATVREVDGPITIRAIGSDLYVRNINGDCIVDGVGSDLMLNLDFEPGKDYRFCAGGDVLCRVQPDTSARFVVPADTHISLDVEADISEGDGGQQIVTLGDGAALVTITGAEELRLIGKEEDYVINLGVQIEEELEARLSTLEEKLNQQLEGLDERIQAKTEYYASQAERLAERAQRQAERAAARFKKTQERKRVKGKRGTSRRVEFAWGSPPRPPAPPAAPLEPVTEQERLMILKMVQENKITIEEAERLLAALDSQG